MARALLVAILIALPSLGQEAAAQEMPPELRGRLHLEVTRCEPAAHGAGLSVAEFSLRTGPSEVRIPGLRCGAYRPGTDDVLFLERVPIRERMPADTTRYLRSTFPADARHSECRCVVGGVERLRDMPAFDPDVNQPLPAWREPRAGPARFPWQRERAPGEPERERGPEILRWPPDPVLEPGPAPLPPPGDDVLRRERVLVPEAALYGEPGGDPSGPQVHAGDDVDVLALRGGWKLVRVPTSGERGWILDDASTADTQAPERLSIALAELEPFLSADRRTASDPVGLCRATSADALDPLVFALLPEIHAVFVTTLWWAMDEAERDAFQIWLSECYDVRRIVDVSSGQELRNLDWGEGPGTARAPGSAAPRQVPSPIL